MIQKNPCLLLIHDSLSCKAAAAIADYILIRGKMAVRQVDIAQWMIGESDPESAENCLTAGRKQATHVMILVSPEASYPDRLSWCLKVSGKLGTKPAFLTLKGMSEVPDYQGECEFLRGIKSLNEYIFRVSPDVAPIIFNNPEYGGLMAHTAPNHPLDAYLDWNQ